MLMAAVQSAANDHLDDFASGGIQIVEGRHEGRRQFVIRTDAATWYYDRAGGGFSRLIDRGGRDWIAFSKSPLKQYPESAAAGYRGLPNLVFGSGNPDAGAGHPGFDRCESEIVAKDTIRTRTRSGKWSWTWTFRETSATFTMEQADTNDPWWFLYEGPIAGTFAPTQKFWGTDRGGPRRTTPDTQHKLFESWRWIYLGDVSVRRVLFLAQHQEDDLADTLWYLGSSQQGAATAPDGMVVVGFGRGPGTRPLLRGAGQQFTVGFLETDVSNAVQHTRVARKIESAMRSTSETSSPRARQLNLWYGPRQSFGHLGEPQRWINVLGNVSPWSELDQLTYSLNGNAPRRLSLGSDLHRLAMPGDFNVELAWDDLESGNNTVSLTAAFRDGELIETVATLHITRGQQWPLPYRVDFGEVETLQDAVQIVDGYWRLTDNGVRTVQPWYDRVLAMGDASWHNYEATVRLTLHDYIPPQPGPPTYNVTHIGLSLRWRGHTTDGRQPGRQWYPLGAQGELLLDNDPPRCRWRVVLGKGNATGPSQPFQLDSRLFLKAQVQTLDDGRTRYRFKHWPVEDAEPEAWGIETCKPGGAEYASGAFCLVPHHSDVTIHEVVVTPLPPQAD